MLSPAAQVEKWIRLARWKSPKSAKQEIGEIRAARTRGRPVRM
jgi:hypothetical protein